MNIGPNHPSGGHPGQGGRRRRRRGRGPSNRPPQSGHGHSRGNSRSPGVFTGPMDHSYRNQMGDGPRDSRGFRGRVQTVPKFFQHPEVEPLPSGGEAQPRIFAFVDDLFFLAKIQETARKLNVKVDFVKSDKELFDKLGENGEPKPSLIIFDLNSASAKPLATIPKLKAKLKKDTNVIGFLSHLQGDLKLKAIEAGCDMVLPRSAFSSNLPQLLRRHATTDLEQEQ